MANIVGKRYVCRVCGSEFIVTKAGAGCLTCHGQPMEMKEPTRPPAPQANREGGPRAPADPQSPPAAS